MAKFKPHPKPLPPLPVLDSYPVGAEVRLDSTAPPAYAGQPVTVRAYSSDNRQFLAELYPGRDMWLPVGYIWGYLKLPPVPIAPTPRKILLYVPASPVPEPLPAATPAATVEVPPVATAVLPEEPMHTVTHTHPFIANNVMADTAIDPITKAEQLQQWLTETGLSTYKAAPLLHVHVATLDNYLRLLTAAPGVQAQIRSGELKMYTALKRFPTVRNSPLERPQNSRAVKGRGPNPEPEPGPGDTGEIPLPEDPKAEPDPGPGETGELPVPPPPAALATIPEQPLVQASEDLNTFRLQLLDSQRLVAALINNLVEAATLAPIAPVAPAAPLAAPTSIVINITVADGGVVTIQQ